MKKIIVFFLVTILIISNFSITNKIYAMEVTNEYLTYDNENPTRKINDTTPVGKHGKLSVNGTDIVDQNGNKFQLRGVSTHGLQWFSQYVNQDAFTYMRDEWGINAVRLAMYSNPNDGYSTNLHDIVKNGVEYAKNAGLYVIIDWHILNDGNPNINKDSAIKFFREMANLYKDEVNVIYEICNEPNGDVQWERDVKPYAEEVIKEIRHIDNDAIIVVGTPTWSQDVDIVAQSPIQGYDNIMYTLHFYAATHKEYLRQKLQTALNAKLPVFVTEFGICDASGNGNLDIPEANTWIDFLNNHNISWMCWNLSNKDESSSLLKNTDKITNWTNDDLSEGGKWLLEALKRSNNESDDDTNIDSNPDNDNNDNNRPNTDVNPPDNDDNDNNDNDKPNTDVNPPDNDDNDNNDNDKPNTDVNPPDNDDNNNNDNNKPNTDVNPPDNDDNDNNDKPNTDVNPPDNDDNDNNDNDKPNTDVNPPDNDDNDNNDNDKLDTDINSPDNDNNNNTDNKIDNNKPNINNNNGNNKNDNIMSNTTTMTGKTDWSNNNDNGVASPATNSVANIILPKTGANHSLLGLYSILILLIIIAGRIIYLKFKSTNNNLKY